MSDLEKYLRKCNDEGIIDHQIRVISISKDMVTFYIHANGKNSDTLDFSVKGNLLVQL